MRASFLRVTLAQDMLDTINSQSPDGLSLRGPMTFVVVNRGKESIYTQMHDGRLDAAQHRRACFRDLLTTSTCNSPRATRTARTPTYEGRFIVDL